MKKSSNPQIRPYKYTHFTPQIKTVFDYLNHNISTASMVAEATSIRQKNICRYKRTLEKSGLLFQVKKDVCKVTGFKAWYLSCNPKYSNTNQLTIFEL